MALTFVDSLQDRGLSFPVTATLTDRGQHNRGVSDVSWQWYRGENLEARYFVTIQNASTLIPTIVPSRDATSMARLQAGCVVDVTPSILTAVAATYTDGEYSRKTADAKDCYS